MSVNFQSNGERQTNHNAFQDEVIAHLSETSYDFPREQAEALVREHYQLITNCKGKKFEALATARMIIEAEARKDDFAVIRSELKRVFLDYPTSPNREQLLQAARDLYAVGSNDDIEIDDDAHLSPNGEGGTWVQAWVYVNHEELTA